MWLNGKRSSDISHVLKFWADSSAWLERQTDNLEVLGSNPSPPTKISSPCVIRKRSQVRILTGPSNFQVSCVVMDIITYKLVLEHSSVNLKEVFDKFSAVLKSMGHGLQLIQETPDKFGISYTSNLFKATLEFVSSKRENSDVALSQEIILTANLSDSLTLSMARYGAHQFGLRIFHPLVGCFLPTDPRFIHMSHVVLDPQVKGVVESFGFTPVFYIQGTKVVYASSSQDGEIHILNNHLVDYFTEPGAIKENSGELSYPVAPDLKTFVALVDRELVPEKFYEYYKRSVKIFNHSGFNIKNPGRKVFVKPYIFEFDNEKQGFYKIAKDGSSVIRMDKILKGETLDDTIKRVLRDLNIGDDYLKAKVLEEIEFDRDKEGRLTPRLLVMVYMERIANKEEFTRKAAQKWVPIDHNGHDLDKKPADDLGWRS